MKGIKIAKKLASLTMALALILGGILYTSMTVYATDDIVIDAAFFSSSYNSETQSFQGDTDDAAWKFTYYNGTYGYVGDHLTLKNGNAFEIDAASINEDENLNRYFNNREADDGTIVPNYMDIKVENGATLTGFTDNTTTLYVNNIYNNGTIEDGNFNAANLYNNDNTAIIEDGTYTVQVGIVNSGTINGGEFHYGTGNTGGRLFNRGTIEGGDFTNECTEAAIANYEQELESTGAPSDENNTRNDKNLGEIEGGTFHNSGNSLKLLNDGTISDGSFAKDVTNKENATITGGTFTQAVTNNENATIVGGTFQNTVTNRGTIEVGTTSPTFTSDVINEDTGRIARSVVDSIPTDRFTNSGTIVEAPIVTDPSSYASGSAVTEEPKASGSAATEESKASGSAATEESKVDITPYHEFYDYLISQIKSATAGKELVLDTGRWNTYSLSLLQQLLNRNDVTRVLKYTYQGKRYTVTIPAGSKFTLDENIKWYGPLKLAQLFGADITSIK